MFDLMIEQLRRKTATIKLKLFKFLCLKCSHKPEGGPVIVFARVSFEGVQPVRHPYRSMFSIKLHYSFTGNQLWSLCSPFNPFFRGIFSGAPTGEYF